MANAMAAIAVNPKIQFRAVSKSFADLRVLADISLSFEQGRFVSLLGPSGCGKTTLLRIVGGLDTCDTGEVLIDGRQISAPGRDRGFVFQKDNLLPWRTVRENVVLGPELAHASRSERSSTSDLIKLVGLQGFENYYPRQLSGGMRQRVNLARALAINPDVLLMDEPFSALDAQTREIMQTELLRIWESGRKTVLFVTHQIDEAVYLSDFIVVLARRPGRVQKVVTIDLPRPRPLGMKRSPEFVRYVDEIWTMIERDVRESMMGEPQP
jgi:NitT/TauT family transport system ATP-binding protein